jgi:predicted dehydrogenase
MKRIKIGHLGLGHLHSEGKMACVRRFPEIFDVVGIAEPDEKTWQKFHAHRTYSGLQRLSVEELLNRQDIDAIMVECDDWNLVQYGQWCIDAGKHIHLDKPAGENISDFEQLMKSAEDKNLTVQMAYMYRYNPAVLKTIGMVKRNELGEILQIDTVMSREHTDEIRIWLKHFEGGTMHTFGCHLVDLHLLFQGTPVRIVPYKKKTMLRNIDVYDHDLAVFEYSKGISTVRTSSFEVNGYERRQLVVCGTEGTVELKPLETNRLEEFTKMYVSTK